MLSKIDNSKKNIKVTQIKKTFEFIIFSLPDIGITKMYIISNIA